MGALEASRYLEPGQVASRAVPVPGPTAEPAVRAATVDLGTQVAMADQAAKVDQGTPWALVGRPWAMASPGSRGPWWVAPPKIVLGDCIGGIAAWGALWKRGR